MKVDWQPIETYRKVSDKTKPVLLFFPSWGVEMGRPEFSGYASFLIGEHRVPEQPDSLPDQKAGPRCAPTHWMPLPAPPA